MRIGLIIVFVLASAGGPAADENDLINGFLIAHHPPGLVYTTAGVDWCSDYDTNYALSDYSD